MSATIVLLLLSTADLATGARLPQQQQGWVKCADKSTSLMKSSQYCTCPGFVRYGDPLKNDGEGAWWTVDGKLVLVDARLHNGTILCDEKLYFGRKDEMDGNMVCQCGSEVPTTPAQTSATPAPSSNTTTALWETSASFQSTPSTSAPTTTSAPATTPSPNVTKGVNSTSTFANASTGNRALLDPRTVQQMAGTTTAVVVSVVAASVAASLAGASSGPGALAVIGEVQIMSQLGKVGGGKGALKQFSDSFAWANAELPFSLYPGGNEPERVAATRTADSEAGLISDVRFRRWYHEIQRSSRRGKRPIPNVGETVEQQDPTCKKDKSKWTEDERKECETCGIVNGMPMLDQITVILGSFSAVFVVRQFAQFVWTKCLKREKMVMLMFPNWEGPLLLVHWFGLCMSLAQTLGRPCPLWYGVAAGIIVFGPIIFMLYAMYCIRNLIKNKDVVFTPHEPFPYALMRERLTEEKGFMNKAKVLNRWYTATRHKGDWELKDDRGRFWHFLLKDFTDKSWKYFLWLLLRKLLLALAMALTMDRYNAISVFLLQFFDVLYLFFSFPNEDQVSNLIQSISGQCNLLTIALVSLPHVVGDMPDWCGDLTLICCALAGTAINAFNAIIGPLAMLGGLIGKGLGTCFGPCQSLIEPCLAGAGTGVVSAAAAGVTDACIEIAMDACEIGEDEQSGSNDHSQRGPDEGGNVEIIAGAAMLTGAGAVMATSGRTRQLDPTNPPAQMTLRFLLEFEEAGEEGSKNRQTFEKKLLQDLSRASGVSERCFEVINISRGSILAQVAVFKYEAEPGPAPSSIVFFLQHQLNLDDESVLRKGQVTQHLASIDLTENTELGRWTNAIRDLSTDSRKSLADDDVVIHLAVQGSHQKPPMLFREGSVTEREGSSALISPGPGPVQESTSTSTSSWSGGQMSRSQWLAELDRAHSRRSHLSAQ